MAQSLTETIRAKLAHSRITKLGLFTTIVGINLVLIGLLPVATRSILGTVVLLLLGSVVAASGYLGLREATVSNSNEDGSVFSGAFKRLWVVPLAFICAPMLAGIAVTIFPAPPPKEPIADSSGKSTARVDVKLDAATLDSCFLAGKNAATVSLVNITQLAEVDLKLSDVMSEGCARKGATTQNPRECIYNCELGFKATARKAAQ